MSRSFAGIWHQLQLVWQLTFHPDLDSPIYLNRTRLNIAAATMLVLDLLYALAWAFWLPQSGDSNAILIFTAVCSALAWLNLQHRFIPTISPLAAVLLCLWLNMPLLGIYIYLSTVPHVAALAYTIILLVLYIHVQDWRSSALGIALAVGAAPCLYFLATGAWPSPPAPLQIFMLSTALGGAIVVAISSASVTKIRKQYAQKVLKVTQEQMRPALLLQSELIGNMRFEAKNILQDEHQRLALDNIAAQIKSQVDQLGTDIARLVKTSNTGTDSWQAIGIMRISDILVMTRNDLVAHYHFSETLLDEALTQDLLQDIAIEANGAEISQALASLISLMLIARAQLPEDQRPQIALTASRHGYTGKIHLKTQPAFSPHPHERVRDTSIPPFAVHVFRLFHITWQIQSIFADGSPAAIELTCPLPSHTPIP